MYADSDLIDYPIVPGAGPSSSADQDIAKSGFPSLQLETPNSTNDGNESIQKNDFPAPSENNENADLTPDSNPSLSPDPGNAGPSARIPVVIKSARVHVVKKALSVQSHSRARKETADAQALEEASRHHVVGKRQSKKRI